MIKFGNQRVITISKDIDHKNETITNAIRELSGVDFKLWSYLSIMEPGSKLLFSPRKIYNEIGTSEASIRKSFGELIKFKYLIESGDEEYTFYTIPRK